MMKTDKIFAGLILLTMAVFWVIMSPAVITSRSVDAAPKKVTSDQAPATVRKMDSAEPEPKTRAYRVQRTSVPPLPKLEPQRVEDADGNVYEVMPQMN